MQTTNLSRLKMEIEGVDIPDNKLIVYLMENNLEFESEYTRSDRLNILKSALAVLNSLANNTNAMKKYSTGDISVTGYGEVIQNRISQLTRQVAELEYKAESGNSFVNMFR